jgi:hypothetical protein
MRASIGFGFAIVVIAVAACGGDDSGGGALGDGCTTDVECKGDRICVDKECVDPSGGGDGDGDGGGVGDGDAGEGGASGASGASGSGNGGTGGRIDDPELEAACSASCEARDEAGCEMDLSLDQCLGQCLIVDEINHGYCLDEQTAQYSCLAAGGYTCVMGYPQQQSTCISEVTALSQCQQRAPCRMFCDQVAGECAPEGDECITDCEAKQASFEDAICSIYYAQLLSCWSQNGVQCDGDRPAVGNCGAQVSEIADCIGRRNTECDGYCWMADTLGCGSTDCLTDCTAELENTSCGSYYRSVIDCAMGSYELNASCEGGELVASATECASQIEQHTMCLSTMQ